MTRWRRLAILAALLLAGCPSWPNIPEGCRNFGITTWGGGAPWSDVDWTQIAIVDEPMLAVWGWTGDLASRGDVCGAKGLGMVRQRVVDARATGKTVWLNWSFEELRAVGELCGAEEVTAGADVISFDSYGGKWDWYLGKTPNMLAWLWVQLQPWQKMGLVPEGHYAPDWGVKWSTEDLMWVNAAYLEWAMTYDSMGQIFAVAPFHWGPCADAAGNLCIADQPELAGLLADFAARHPRCGP